ncbi:hypothetical protein [Streptomyces lavendofoliae]|uniref:hypothetical protein n=1 Tax=Streptomyces lavendofoliae TaxID=67314 RepID=UPI00300F070B
MGEPGGRDQDKSPLERVTGENDVHPEEERAADDARRRAGREASGGGEPEAADEETGPPS